MLGFVLGSGITAVPVINQGKGTRHNLTTIGSLELDYQDGYMTPLEFALNSLNKQESLKVTLIYIYKGIDFL